MLNLEKLSSSVTKLGKDEKELRDHLKHALNTVAEHCGDLTITNMSGNCDLYIAADGRHTFHGRPISMFGPEIMLYILNKLPKRLKRLCKRNIELSHKIQKHLPQQNTFIVSHKRSPFIFTLFCVSILLFAILTITLDLLIK